jgi:hypothetical protein
MLRPFFRPASGRNTPWANAAASAQFLPSANIVVAERLDIAITGISIRACADAIIPIETACIARGSCVARRRHLSGTRSRERLCGRSES